MKSFYRLLCVAETQNDVNLADAFCISKYHRCSQTPLLYVPSLEQTLKKKTSNSGLLYKYRCQMKGKSKQPKQPQCASVQILPKHILSWCFDDDDVKEQKRTTISCSFSISKHEGYRIGA